MSSDHSKAPPSGVPSAEDLRRMLLEKQLEEMARKDKAREAEEDSLRSEARDHPLVQAVFAAFPKASITGIRTAEDITTEAGQDALPEVEDEWDPFEE